MLRRVAIWVPRGNRTSSRATVGDSSPSRMSFWMASSRLSASFSRWHTQLLCRPSNRPTSTWATLCSRQSALTIHASSSSHRPR